MASAHIAPPVPAEPTVVLTLTHSEAAALRHVLGLLPGGDNGPLDAADAVWNALSTVTDIPGYVASRDTYNSLKEHFCE